MSIVRILRHSLSGSQKFKNSTRYFSINTIKDEYSPGRRLHGFTVKKVQEVPELCLLAVNLIHDQTNAEYLHLARDDSNNVFSVAFRTTPMDSTGIPHILEHTTLCGSRKYPCRDPFFKMLNRSLSTFMNAFTAADNTLYPFSTQNPKDFENLLSVYLDAAFHPNLKNSDFLQEGWRLEHEVVDDPLSPIVFKGVVFNEMKGAFADSDRIFVQHLMNKLLPSHTYSYISGGDPLTIPQLTWEQLKRFHAYHYHPSNARFYTYGNFPLRDHLKIINEEALAGFEKISQNTSVPDEQRWKHPKQIHILCPQDPLSASPEQQTTVAVSYLLGSITDNFLSLTLQLLSSLLTDGPNSPFYQSLIVPNVGSGYSPATGYDGQTKEATFSVGLKGIRDSDVNTVLKKIDETVDDVINGTFPQERIDGLLHNIELSLKHQTSNFGLSLLLNLSSLWNHNGDPCDALLINKHIELFKQKLNENPRFLQEKVKHYFKDNPHKLVLIMQPEDCYNDKIKEAEAKLLDEKVSGLSQSQRSQIFNQGMELQKKQNEESDVSVLPSVNLSDIQRQLQPTELENITLGGVPCQICPQPTNGVTYFRAVLNTADLSNEDKLFLPLFCHIVTRMGAGSMSYQQLSQQIELNTGGLHASVHLTEDATDFGSYEEGISFYSHCLSEKTADMMRLWSHIFNGSNLKDVDRLKTLSAEMAMDLASNVAGVGHRYAMTRAGSTLSSLGALKETYFGLNQVRHMKRLAESDDLAHVSEKMQLFAQKLFTKDHLRVAVNALPDFATKASAEVEVFLGSLKGSPIGGSQKAKDDVFKCEGRKEHVVLPFPVNFVSRCVPGVCMTHQDFAKLEILTKLMSAKFLHREIREKGGAYGGGAATKSSGTVSFYSYRDPKTQATLDAFDAAVDWILQETFTEQDIVEAKLGLFSSVDQPIVPGNKGSDNFLHGFTDKMRQQHRERLLTVSRNDIQDVATRYLKKPKHSGEVILGPETNLLKSKDWVVLSDHNI